MKKVLLTLIVLISCLGTVRAQSFMDNTFIDGMVGVNQYFGSETIIGVGSDVFFGKWFTPVLGSRLGWHGNFGKAVSAHVVRGDLMLNLIKNSPQLAVIPFISVGGDFRPNKYHHLLLGAGCELAFGLADKLQMIIDLGMMSDFDPKDTGAVPYFCNPAMPVGIGIRYSL